MNVIAMQSVMVFFISTVEDRSNLSSFLYILSKEDVYQKKLTCYQQFVGYPVGAYISYV